MTKLEPEVGFEPTTSALQEQRSGQLSYSGDVCSLAGVAPGMGPRRQALLSLV